MVAQELNFVKEAENFELKQAQCCLKVQRQMKKCRFLAWELLIHLPYFKTLFQFEA